MVGLYFTGTHYTWMPLVRIQAPEKQKSVIRTFLKNHPTQSLVSRSSLGSIDWDQMKASLTKPVLVTQPPFFWRLVFTEKYQNRYIYLNKTIREVDINGKLLSQPDQEPVQANSLLYYYPVEIQDPNNIDAVYEKEIAPLIAYMYQSDSGLGPKVRSIGYHPKTGISLTIFKKVCLIGFMPKDSLSYIQEIENKILRLEEYIESNSTWDEFTQFDLRFSDQIICRKHQ